MERRELYDPEDIEQLLSERSFHELLDEERAYVLRHLSGAEEYEAMRAMLQRMRSNVEDSGGIDADPIVRDRVMAAFRSSQRPAWRIWLNSVGASFLPDERSGYWRPALALAGTALLIVAGIAVVRTLNLNDRTNALAEKREVPVNKSQESSIQTNSGPTAADTMLPPVGTPTLSEAVPAEDLATGNAQASAEVARGNALILEQGTAEVDLDDMEQKDHEDLQTTARSDRDEGELTHAEEVPPSSTAVGSTNYMQAETTKENEARYELREVSVATTRKNEKARKKGDQERNLILASRSLARDHQVLGLVNQGW